MLIKDKDILAETPKDDNKDNPKKKRIKKESMRSAWGDAFDYYLRGITEKYLRFRGRATRLEFWGFSAAAGILYPFLWILGEFSEIRMLPYYYALATFTPTLALCARRLHDVNKNAALYLGIWFVAAVSGFFIGWWAFIPVILWSIVLIRLFSTETDITEGFYGAANDNDEVYGEDNIRIIKKFRFIGLLMLVIWLAAGLSMFDDWSTQGRQRAAIDHIMEQLEENGEKASLTPAQIDAAQNLMKSTLKAWNGQEVQEQDIINEINKIIKSVGGEQKSGSNKAGQP